jgi:hypothetical protein
VTSPEHLDLPDGYDPDGGWTAQEWWDALGYSGPRRSGCPDGGACHHQCLARCFRVQYCGPLSGIYPNDLWPVGMDEQRPADFDDEETRS